MVMGSIKAKAEVVVIGAGPGGYVAAIQAANLGKEVVLIESRERLGGVCLIEGCIPSKALINSVDTMEHALELEKRGIAFKKPKVDTKALRKYTEGVIDGLTKGIAGLVKARNIDVIKGTARFDGPNSILLEGAEVSGVDFEYCIIATGSSPVIIPPAKGLDLWTSKEALEVREVPKELLVIGGGVIGLEMGFFYAGLGANVSVVEMQDQLVPGADKDVIKPVQKSAKKHFKNVWLKKAVEKIEKSGGGYKVTIGGEAHSFDRVLLSTGRSPNTKNLGLEDIGINTDQRGFIPVNEEMRTLLPHIFAIGDVVAGPGLAHKASRQGKVAAEVIAKKPSAFDNVAIPAIVFTKPEIAWAGLTEKEAKEQGYELEIGIFPHTALGRAKSVSETEGLHKIIVDKKTGLVLGVAIVGPHATELIAEAALALEMAATLEDILVTIHPHPTFSEALAEAGEMAEGLPVHMPPIRKK